MQLEENKNDLFDSASSPPQDFGRSSQFTFLTAVVLLLSVLHCLVPQVES